jgi:tRNA 2-thiouridine synthesizing protein A
MIEQITTIVDCTNENCPMPLVKTRKAIMKAKNGDIVKVIGTHPQSFDEIPLALDSLGKKILDKGKTNGDWYIIFKV